MKAGYVMEAVRQMRDTPFPREMVYDELSRLESMISEEIHHEGAVSLDPMYDEETELLVPHAYDGMYIHYLCAKLDQMLQEYDSANTEMTVFQGLYDEYAKWYRRTHMPEQGARVRNYV